MWSRRLLFGFGFVQASLSLIVAGARAAEPPVAAAAATAPQDAAAQPAATADLDELLQDSHALASWIAQRSLDVSAAKQELSAARAEYRDGQLLQNPSVDLSVSNFALGEKNPPGLSYGKMLIYGAGVSELVELGKRGPRGEAATLRARAAERSVAVTLGERVADARQALGRLLYTRARADELDQSLVQAQRAADVAKGRLQHQALSGVDYDRLLIDLGGVQSDAVRARAEADAAQIECDTLLRAHCVTSSSDVNLLSRVEGAPAQSPALDERADIARLQLEAAAAERDATLAARKAVPDLTFRLGYTRDTFTISGDQAHTLGLSVSAPLPVFDQGQHAKSAALARAASLTDRRTNAILEARSSVAALRTHETAISSALSKVESEALPRALAVLGAEEHGLSEGQLDITDLVLARRDAIGLRLQSLDLRFELFTTHNELRHALGLDAALLPR